MIAYCVLRITFVDHQSHFYNPIICCHLYITVNGVWRDINLVTFSPTICNISDSKLHSFHCLSFSFQWFSSVVSCQSHLRSFYKIQVLKAHYSIGMTWVLSRIFEAFPRCSLMFIQHWKVLCIIPDEVYLYLHLHLCLYICLYLHIKINLCPPYCPKFTVLSIISFILLLSCSRQEPKAYLQPLVSFLSTLQLNNIQSYNYLSYQLNYTIPTIFN